MSNKFRIVLALTISPEFDGEVINASLLLESIEREGDEDALSHTFAVDANIYDVDVDTKEHTLELFVDSLFAFPEDLAQQVIWSCEHEFVTKTEFKHIESYA